jgi:hypothetical protein
MSSWSVLEKVRTPIESCLDMFGASTRVPLFVGVVRPWHGQRHDHGVVQKFQNEYAVVISVMQDYFGIVLRLWDIDSAIDSGMLKRSRVDFLSQTWALQSCFAVQVR